MIDLPFSSVIEAAAEPNEFGFYSPEPEGFTGVGYLVEVRLYPAKCGMQEQSEPWKKQGFVAPSRNPNAAVSIQNEQRVAQSLVDGESNPNVSREQRSRSAAVVAYANRSQQIATACNLQRFAKQSTGLPRIPLRSNLQIKKTEHVFPRESDAGERIVLVNE
jgi:hypothetical protein